MSMFDIFNWMPSDEEVAQFTKELEKTEGGRQLLELVDTGTISLPAAAAAAVAEPKIEVTYDPTRQQVVPVTEARTVTNVAQGVPSDVGSAAYVPPSVTAAAASTATPANGTPDGGAGGGTGRGGTGGGGTGGETGGETESERIARLDREQRAAQFAAQQAAEAAATASRRENAFGVINSFLGRAGLRGLESQIRSLLAQGIEDSDAILFQLRDTEQFRTRFKANAARAAKGLPELDPATYIGLEQQYRSVLVANRLPTDFYDSPDDFQKLIEGDVSPSEFQSRINEGYAKVRDADPQVLNTLRQFYPEVGNDENALAAYFIDPDRALTSLQRQVEAARIGARGREQAGFQFGAGTAEELVRRGYTAEGTQAAFQRAGQLAGLYQEMGGEEALTEEQKVGAALGFDVQAEQALLRRQRQRLAEFGGGGGFARTSGATSGTVETGVGTAQ